MLQASELLPQHAVRREVVNAGDYFMQLLATGETMRILDLEGNQAADTLFYSAADPGERYSAVDTIREQGNVYLSAGSKLLSNLGNEMLTIVADTCGRHDTLGGACAAESIDWRPGIEAGLAATSCTPLKKAASAGAKDMWLAIYSFHNKQLFRI